MRFTILVTFALAISSVGITGPANSAEVKFATFNVYWLFDDKAPHKKWWDDFRGKTGQTYDQAIAAVAAVIKKTEADVIGLQEVEHDDVVKDLQVALKAMGVDYPHRWTGKGADNTTGQDVAMLSRFPADGAPVLEHPGERETYLTEIDRGNEKTTGLSKVLRVNIKIGNETLPVFVLHLKSQRGGYESDQQRQAQSSIIRRLTLPLIRNGQRFIVMGDMNADRGSQSLRRLRGLDDVEADLVQPIHLKAFMRHKWTYWYGGRGQQIDHVLVSPALAKAVKSGRVVYGHDRSASDHNPLILTLDLN